MPIRDLLVTAVILGSLPFCFRHTWIGVLVWTWIGVMTPQWLTWGFAQGIPFSQLVAIATLAGLPFARDRAPLPRCRETYLLIALWGIYTVTTLFALYPDEAGEQWIKVSKILLFTFIALFFIRDRVRYRYLALVLAMSIGFFGLKGGFWALVKGGEVHLEGPEGSFIGGNTNLALGLDMALPFLFYLAREERRRWLRRLLWAMFIASIPAVMFTYSRGGFLGLVAVLVFLAMKTKRRVAVTIMLGTIMAALLAFAPAQWFERADTIVNYENDGSALGRLAAWQVAFRFAQDHPVLGGGFWVTARPEIWQQYLGTTYGAVPHSIWFSTLSEHGFVGAAVFVSLLVSCFLTLNSLRKPRHGAPPPSWICDYSRMLQISLIAYAVSGTFLNAAYIDIYYTIVALVILLRVLAERESGLAKASASPPSRAALAGRTRTA